MPNNKHRICLEHNQVETMLGWIQVDDAFDYVMKNKIKVSTYDYCPICLKEQEFEKEICYA